MELKFNIVLFICHSCLFFEDNEQKKPIIYQILGPNLRVGAQLGTQLSQ